LGEGESVPHVDLESRLVILDDQQVLTPGLDHIPLAEHRIPDHDFPVQREDSLQFLGGLMFVGLGIDTDLGQDRFDGRGVGGDEVLAGPIALATPPRGLAIDRDRLERAGWMRL
jgi:hypothetical protein